MRGILSRLFGSNPQRRQAEILLDAITAEARRPAFYADLGVPDTLDGRFDMMVLVATLVFRTLQKTGGEALAQRTADHMFMAFDDAVRSLGVGDSGVPRRVKTMGKAYLGRAVAYDAALKAADRPALAEAVLRNIYRGIAPDGAALDRFTAWVEISAQTLALRTRTQLESGDFGLTAP